MKRIKIGNVFYKIKYEDGPLLGDKQCRGYCEVDKKLIVILNTLSKDDALSTLKHEALHAIEQEYSMPIPHKLIYKLEGPLAKLIKDNYRPKRKK